MAASIISMLIGPIASILNKVIPDKAAAAAAVTQLQELATQGQLQQELIQLQALTSAQTDIDKVEAASPSLWISGWRPGAGWVCVAGMATNYLIAPLLTWGSVLVGHPVTLPTLDIETLMPLLFALLGMGTLRSFDKVKGVASR